jgi:hypothetical protein
LQRGIGRGERIAVGDLADAELGQPLLGDGLGDEVAVVEEQSQLRAGEERRRRAVAPAARR